MEKLSALIHAHAGDEHCLGRLLESLRPCDEVLVVNEGSSDEVTKVAHQYGATVKQAVPGVTPGAYLMDAKNDWILSLRACEALSEQLEAALFEWKEQEHETSATFSIALREETSAGWRESPPVTRLVNRTVVNWIGELPKNEANSVAVEGEILHFKNTHR